MAAANVTLGDAGHEFECDNTAALTATLQTPGGVVTNTGSVNAFINVDGGTVPTSQPCGGSGRFLPPGASVVLPVTCRSFTFYSLTTTYLLYSKG